MKKKTSYIVIAIIIIVGLVLDLVTKWFFAEYFAEGADDIVVIDNFFRFTYVENTGAAYGIFGGNAFLLAIVSVIFVIAFAVYDYFNHSNDIWYVIGISLIISGAIGNLIDRIFLGYVRDFISINLFSFVFNIADLWITVGVISFVIHLILSIINERKVNKSNGMDNK